MSVRSPVSAETTIGHLRNMFSTVAFEVANIDHAPKDGVIYEIEQETRTFQISITFRSIGYGQFDSDEFHIDIACTPKKI
jgi:hypothetical protein